MDDDNKILGAKDIPKPDEVLKTLGPGEIPKPGDILKKKPSPSPTQHGNGPDGNASVSKPVEKVAQESNWAPPGSVKERTDIADPLNPQSLTKSGGLEMAHFNSISEDRLKAENHPFKSEQEYQESLTKPTDPVTKQKQLLWADQKLQPHRDIYKASKEAEKTHDYEGANEKILGVISKNPNDAYSWNLLYQNAKAASDPNAPKYLDQALALDPNNANLLANKGVLAHNASDPQAAWEAGDKLEKLPPDADEAANMKRKSLALTLKAGAIAQTADATNQPELKAPIAGMLKERDDLDNQIKEVENRWQAKPSAWDWISYNGVNNSMLGMLLKSGLSKDELAYKYDKNGKIIQDPSDPMLNYKPNTFEEVSSQFLSLLIDSGPMLGMSQWAEAGKAAQTGIESIGAFSGGKGTEAVASSLIKKNAIRIAQKTADRMIELGLDKDAARQAVAKLAERIESGPMANLIRRAAATAGSLGGYGATSEALKEISDPNISWEGLNYKNIVLEGVKQMALGAVVGGVSGVASTLSDAIASKGLEAGTSKALMRAEQTGVQVGGFGAEVGAFTLGGIALDPKKHFKDLTTKDFVENAAVLGVMRIPEVVGTAAKGLQWAVEKSFNPSKVNTDLFHVDFTPDEVKAIYGGYEPTRPGTRRTTERGLRPLPTSEALIQGLNLHPDKMMDVMKSDEVPMDLKMKLLFAIKGVMMNGGIPGATRIETRQDQENGKSYLLALNDQNQVVFANTYNTADEASAEAIKYTQFINEAQKRIDANDLNVRERTNVATRLRGSKFDYNALKTGLDKSDKPWTRTPEEVKAVDKFDSEVAKEKAVREKAVQELMKASEAKGEKLTEEEAQNILYPVLKEPPAPEPEPEKKPEEPTITPVGKLAWGASGNHGGYTLPNNNYVWVDRGSDRVMPSTIGQIFGKRAKTVYNDKWYVSHDRGPDGIDSQWQFDSKEAAEKRANEIIRNTEAGWDILRGPGSEFMITKNGEEWGRTESYDRAQEIIDKEINYLNENKDNEGSVRVQRTDGGQSTINPSTTIESGQTTQEGDRLVSGEEGATPQEKEPVVYQNRAYEVEKVDGNSLKLKGDGTVDNSKVLRFGGAKAKPLAELLDKPVNEVNYQDINYDDLMNEAKYRVNKLNVETTPAENSAVASEAIFNMSLPKNANKTLSEALDDAASLYRDIRNEDQEKAPDLTPEIHKQPKGSSVTTPNATFDDAVKNNPKDKGKNLWVRNDKGEDNSDRTLLVQFSSDLLNGGRRDPTDPSERYYDKLYRTRPGYDRTFDFWEVPLWMSRIAAIADKSDVYVVRDMDEAQNFIKESGYKNIAFSALDINEKYISQIADDNTSQKISVGGYTNLDNLKTKSNISIYNSISDFAKQNGHPDEYGFSYRHFDGTQVIPRLQLSTGCKFKCAFYTVPKEIISIPDEAIDRQVESLAALGAKLVYLDDKTFGQSPNYKRLPEIYNKIIETNPDFQGFVIQTTAGQFTKFSSEFLKQAHIKYVELGVESYNDEILAKLHKPASEKTIDAAVKKLREEKIAFIPNIVVGFSGINPDGSHWEETPETYQHTMDFLKANEDIISHTNVYNLALYEGTELADNIDAKAESDKNENNTTKSFHEDKLIHQQAMNDFTDQASRALDKAPFEAHKQTFPDKVPESVRAVFVAPYRDLSISSPEEAAEIRERPDYKAYIESIHNVAKAMGISVNRIDNTIGLFEGGQEVSNRIDVNAPTLDEAEKFAALIRATSAPETQKATIAAEYLDEWDKPNQNAIEIEVKVGDAQKAINALKKAGINDATYNESTGTIQIVDIENGKDTEFNDKVSDFLNKVIENGTATEQAERHALESRYVDPDRRTELLQSIKAEHPEKGTEIRGILDEAIRRAKEFDKAEAKVELKPEAQAELDALNASLGLTNTPLSADKHNKISETINDLAKKATHSLPVEVVKSQADLPQNIQDAAGEGRVKAALDQRTHQIYLVSDNLHSEDAAIAAWVHEQGVHAGLRSLLPDHKELDNLLNKVYSSVGLDKIKDTVDKLYIDQFNKGDMSKAELAEEYMAKIGEKVVNKEALTDAEKGLWQKLLDFVRGALKDMIGKSADLTDDEIADIVKASTASVYEQTGPAGVTNAEGVKFSLRGFAEDTKDFADIGLPKRKKMWSLRDIYEAYNNYYNKRYGSIEGRLQSTKGKSGETLEKVLENNKEVRHQTIPRASRFMADEVEYMVKAFGGTDKSGLGWYTHQYQHAIQDLAKLFPELKDNDNGSADLFTMLTAITSDQTEVYKNLGIAADVYSRYRDSKDGVIPYVTEGSNKTAAYNENIDRINGLLKEFDGDMGKLTDWLLETKKGSEFRKEAAKEGRDFKNDWEDHIKIPRAVTIFGPKLGVYFANLMGTEGWPTMDRWESRTFNRYRGTVLSEVSGLGEEGNVKGVGAFKEWIGKPDLSDEDAIHEATLHAKAYIKRGYRTELEQKVGFKEGTTNEDKEKFNNAVNALDLSQGQLSIEGEGKSKEQLLQDHYAEKSGNTIYKDAVGTRDMPDNPADRTLQYETFKEAQKKLSAKGIDLSIADIQAALWYFEKAMYVKAGGKADALGVSYGDVSKNIVKNFEEKGSFFNAKEAEAFRKKDPAVIAKETGQTTLFSKEEMSAGDRQDMTNKIRDGFDKFKEHYPEKGHKEVAELFKEAVLQKNPNIPKSIINDATREKVVLKPIDFETSLKNAVVEAEKKKMFGVAALQHMKDALQSTDLDHWFNEAKQGISDGVFIPDEVTRRVLTEHSGSVMDEAVLLVHRAQLRNEEIDILNRMRLAKDSKSIMGLQTDLNNLYAKISDNDMAAAMIGREASNIFRLRKAYTNSEMSLFQMEREYLATKNLESLTPEEQEYVRSRFQELRELREKVADFEKKEAAKKERQKVSEVIEREGKQKPKSQQTSEERIAAAKQRMLERRKPKMSAESDVKLSAESEKAKELDPEDIKDIMEIAREHSRSGVKDLDELIDKTLADVKDVAPELTARDIMEHLTGYAKDNEPKTKAEHQIAMGEMKKEARLRLKLEDLSKSSKSSPFIERDSDSGAVKALKEEGRKRAKELGITEREYNERRIKDIARRTKQIEEKLQNKDYTTLKKEAEVFEKSDELVKAERSYALRYNQWKEERQADLAKSQPLAKRFMNGVFRLQRFAVLSYISTIGKIAAVLGHSFILKPLMVAAQELAYQLTPKGVSGKADIWGRVHMSSLAKYYTAVWKNLTWDNFMQQMKGHDINEIMYGDPHVYEEWSLGKGLIEAPGRTHGWMKSFLKTAELAFAHEQLTLNRLEHAKEVSAKMEALDYFDPRRDELLQELKKYDPNREENRLMIKQMAVEYGRWGILMNKNQFVKGINSFIEANGVPGALLKTEIPIIRIPSNYIDRALTFKYGLIYALVGKRNLAGDMKLQAPGLVSFIWNGTKNLDRDQADIIQRNIVLGSMGMSAFLLGAFHHNTVKKKDDGSYDVTFGGTTHNISHLALHVPFYESFLNGCSVGNNLALLEKKGDLWGSINDILRENAEADWETASKSPFANMLQYGFFPNLAKLGFEALKGKGDTTTNIEQKIGAAFVKKIVDMVDPGWVKEWAKRQSQKQGGMGYPKTPEEVVLASFPWLWKFASKSIDKREMDKRAKAEEVKMYGLPEEELEAKKEAAEKKQAVRDSLEQMLFNRVQKEGLEYYDKPKLPVVDTVEKGGGSGEPPSIRERSSYNKFSIKNP